jgi:hypothetical protein
LPSSIGTIPYDSIECLGLCLSRVIDCAWGEHAAWFIAELGCGAVRPPYFHSQWSCRELATVLARETGIQLSRERVRCVLKKVLSYYCPPPGGLILPQLPSRMPRSNSQLSNTRPVGERSFCSLKTKPASGALPCLGRAGGAQLNARTCVCGFSLLAHAVDGVG